MATATLSRPGLWGVAAAAALVALCIALAAAAPGALAAGGDAQPASSLPSLAKVCDTFAINGSRDFFNACRKRSDREPAALVEACDAVAKEPAAAAGDALASAFTALAEGRADTAPARDVDAACALATVYRAHTAACEAPRGSLAAAPGALAAGCAAARGKLLGNAGATLGDAASAAASAPAGADIAKKAKGDAATMKATAVACRLLGEGFGAGGGAVSSALSEAPKSLQARACDLSKGFGFRRLPSECQRLYDACKKSNTLRDAFAAGRNVSPIETIFVDPLDHMLFDEKDLGGGGALPAEGASNAADAVLHNGFHAGGALGDQESGRKAADAAALNAAGGALAAAFTGLEKRDMSGATPEAIATACTVGRSHNLLRGACAESLPCSAASDSAYERLCLDVFRRGESKLPTARDVDIDITDTMSSIWKANHPGERAIRREFVHTDCCDKISSSECRCDMRKRIIRESGKAPTAWCLNTKELQSCKP